LKFNPYDYNYSYSEWEHIIDEWIFDERNRKIAKRRFLDGVKLESLAEEFELSVQQTKTILQRSINILIKHI
jgi:DNA invertase Pin-like site-specific DNA recombinase